MIVGQLLGSPTGLADSSHAVHLLTWGLVVVTGGLVVVTAGWAGEGEGIGSPRCSWHCRVLWLPAWLGPRL